MTQNTGASSFEDRAATATQPSPEEVSGKAGIPCAWQPIETAPDDGTRILIAPHMMTAWWEFGDNTWLVLHVPLQDDKSVAYDWRARAPLYFCVSANMLGTEPTHWMPLPDPPESVSA